MPLHILDHKLWFPPLHEALEDGLLAIGGDLSPERVLLAYHKGIFPWFENDEIPMWWSPDPRFVLYPEKLHISHSLKSILKKNTFHWTINQAFEAVIQNCQKTKRKEQDGTWITHSIIECYQKLHEMGYALSVECWDSKNNLVGGLYGVLIGKIFFGESMFSLMPNASKFAFTHFVQDFLIEQKDVKLIDCQVYTNYLESFGAEMIPRLQFVELLQKNIEL